MNIAGKKSSFKRGTLRKLLKINFLPGDEKLNQIVNWQQQSVISNQFIFNFFNFAKQRESDEYVQCINSFILLK